MSRRVRRRATRRHRAGEGTKRFAAIERLEERLLLTSAPIFDSSSYTGMVADDAMSGEWILSVIATDPDADMVSYQFDSASSSAPFSVDPGTGDITVNGMLDAGMQSEYPLTVEAMDPGGLIGTATVTISVMASNSPPVAYDDSYSVNEDDVLNVPFSLGLLDNDSDPNGDSLTAYLDSGPTNGYLDLYSDGSFSYAPNPGYFGSDSFYYYVSDGTANSSQPVGHLAN